eukprot:g65671.t1
MAEVTPDGKALFADEHRPPSTKVDREYFLADAGLMDALDMFPSTPKDLDDSVTKISDLTKGDGGRRQEVATMLFKEYDADEKGYLRPEQASKCLEVVINRLSEELPKDKRPSPSEVVKFVADSAKEFTSLEDGRVHLAQFLEMVSLEVDDGDEMGEAMS